MRSVELAKVAASAEALRLRQMASRQAMRGAYGAVAAVFGIAVLVCLHVLLWEVCLLWLSPLIATLIVLAVDVVVAAIAATMALRNTPSAAEQEALALRQQAVIELRRSLTVMGMATQVGAAVFGGGGRRSTTSALASAAARLVGRR